MNKEVIIIGDIEMGGGTLTDDFISDQTLSRLIYSLCNKNVPVDLVLNGDTFDFLKCPYIENQVASYPRHITAEISLAKLRLIYNAHTPVFEALKRFVAEKKNRIVFVIGNHDADVVHPEVQECIRKLLNSSENVFFSFYYNEQGIHAEHGHQYDFLNKVNEEHLFLTHKGQKILNIPWVSLGLISKFMILKEQYPMLERITPRPAMFSNHKTVEKVIAQHGLKYLLKSLIYYPIRYYSDPTYTFPKELVREFYRRWKHVHWDIDEIVTVFKKKRRAKLHRNKIYVFGHVHKRYTEQNGKITIIHPDTWRDEYFLDTESRLLTAKSKRYVHISVETDQSVSWRLVDVPVQRSVLHFDDVIRDEKKYVQLAAQEEGYEGALS
ncbi:MAG TPA: metallophosphoesterase [Candidatus Nanoarchaeia archaeon]|nr:metallophosphoesterase [Candidatus Nanoarchaeia archaeon]